MAIGPNVKNGFVSTTFYQHEATLRLMMPVLGLTKFPGDAATAPDMRECFLTGIAPAVSLSPTSLAFASHQVGTTSAAQGVTLSNTGTASLTISSIAASGDYAQTNTRGTSVAAGTNCTINVTFAPTAVETRSGAVTITDNASGSPQVVKLKGTGN